MFSAKKKSKVSSFFRNATVVPIVALAVGAVSGCALEGDAPPEAHEEHLGQVQSAWDIDSYTDESKATHLFIVNRALDLLGDPDRAPNPNASRLRREMLENSTCNEAWRRGLYDADYRAEFNGGNKDITPESGDLEILASGATWASHFYDPDTQKNYEGNTSPTARTQAAKSFEITKQEWKTNRWTAC